LDIASALGMSAGSEVTIWGLAWEGLRLATNGPSWLSDATMYLDDAVAPDEVGVFLRPGAEPDETPAGVGNNRPGVATYSSGGFHLLEDFGLAPMTLPDGVLRLEFYEIFDDVLGLPDATWTAGTVTLLAIPAPGPVALCALAAGISATRRR